MWETQGPTVMQCLGPMQTVSGPVHVAAVSAHGGLMSRYSILLPVSFYTP